jgi:hypothetical protein
MRMTSGQEIVKIETRLRQLGTKLDRLEGLGAEVAEDSQADFRKQIDHIKEKHTVVREKLQRFKDAGGQKWESFKDSVELAWQELEQAFRTVRHGPPVPIPAKTEVMRTPRN